MTEITVSDLPVGDVRPCTWPIGTCQHWVYQHSKDVGIEGYCEQAAAEERAKIVAWLRSRDQLEDCYSELQDDWLSNRIEAREHEIPQETSNEALS